jgi:hypothetical protein
MAQSDLNKSVEDGVRLSTQFREAQLRRINDAKKEAVQIEEGLHRLDALKEVQRDVAQAHAQSSTEVGRLQKKVSGLDKQIENVRGWTTGWGLLGGKGGWMNTMDQWMREQGWAGHGALWLKLEAEKKQASADLQDEIKREIALKKELDAVNKTTKESERVESERRSKEEAETERQRWAPRDYSSAIKESNKELYGTGGPEEPVTDVSKAIADRIKDTERTEEREKFGRPAAREGAELGEFLSLGPAKDEIQSFMNSLEGLSKAQVDRLLDARSFQIEMSGDIASADKLMREEAMAGLQAHHAEIKRLEDVKKLQEVQAKAGSLEERLMADPKADPNDIIRAQYDDIKTALDAGTLSAQMYSEKLARVSVAYQSAGSMADQLAKVKLSEFQQQKQAMEGGKSFQTQYEDLQKAFFDGTLNTSQYRFAIKDLSEAMRASTAAAKAEAAEKKKAADQRKRDLEEVERLTKDAYKNTTSQQPGQQIAEGPMDQLQKAHAMAMARVQLLAPTKLFGRNIAGFRLGDIRKRREEFQRAVSDVNNIQRMIEEMRMSAMRGPVMAMAANAPVFGQGVGDPGLVTQQGNVTISLPNVSRVNNEDIATLSDRLEEYHERQGSRRV